jgi:uncharacterized small protein (DUF1192 family)
MSFDHDTSRPSRTWLRAFYVVILTVASTLSIVNSAVLFRFLQQGKAEANTHQLQALGKRLEGLSRKVEAFDTMPSPASTTAVSALHQELDARLAKLEKDHDVAELTQRLNALQAQVEKIQAGQIAKRKARQQSAISPPRTQTAAPPPPKEPAFRVMGIEMRGGERFVSVIAANAASLSQARLLRPGDMEGPWLLDRIESEAAMFRDTSAGTGSQTRRLPLP